MKNYETIQHEALKACIDLYMLTHMSELKNYNDNVKKCFEIGQEWYSIHSQNKKPELT